MEDDFGGENTNFYLELLKLGVDVFARSKANAECFVDRWEIVGG
jgi:hypothetical protein